MQTVLEAKDVIRLRIDAYTSEGWGVGRYNGIAVFVPGSLKDEEVEVTIEKIASSYAVGRLSDIIVRSADRLSPICRYYESCGGCDMMHMNYGSQLAFKRGKVFEALKRIGGFDTPNVKDCIGADTPVRYRNKAVFSFDGSAGFVNGGCIEPSSHRVVAVDDCMIESETSVRLLKTVTDWANRNGISAYNEKTGKGCLRHLIVRSTADGETMAVIITAYPLKSDGISKMLVNMLLDADSSIKSIINNINPAKTSLILGKTSRLLFGVETITETLNGFSFDVSAESFLQVNHDQTQKLYRTAVDALELDDRDDVIDLYCGIGTISLMIAASARSVTGIESVAPAIIDARKNAVRNGISNAEFICGNAEAVLPALIKKKRVTKILLDPPRKGAMPAVIEAIGDCGAERIVYVSCEPATLARDCRLLAEKGYQLDFAQPFDMFPQTKHVESVILMSRAGS